MRPGASSFEAGGRPRVSPLITLAVVLALSTAAPAAASTEATRKHSVPIKLGPTVRVILTTADLHRALTPMPSVTFSTASVHVPALEVDEKLRYQAIKGVGGAMTDSSAWLIYDRLNPGTRAWLMRQLFSPQGIWLRFIKLPMGATDFTANGVPYSYDDLPAGQTDPALSNFSIVHDEAYVIPALRQALGYAKHAFVMATPWSPPAWMKTSGVLNNPADNPGWLKQDDYGAMAQYFVKFLHDYEAAGVGVNAITPQNEPGQKTTYPGADMSESDESSFIASDLAPALRSAGLHTQIYGYDNDWFTAETPFASQLISGPAANDLSGVSSHCYFGSPALMSALHYQAPKLDEIVSECAPGTLPFSTSELEIAAMRNWASAVGLWNFALDQRGGPVQPPNYGCEGCTGIVTINTATHRVIFTRDYYELGQLSKFVDPGAVRIASTHLIAYRYIPTGTIVASPFATPGVDDVAFRNPDGGRVLVAYNSATGPAKFAVRDDGYSFTYELAPGATATFIWKPVSASAR